MKVSGTTTDPTFLGKFQGGNIEKQFRFSWTSDVQISESGVIFFCDVPLFVMLRPFKYPINTCVWMCETISLKNLS